MPEDDKPARMVIGNKVIYAHHLTVHGSINLTEDDPDQKKPLEILSLTCDAGVLDISVRNPNSASSLISSARLEIDELSLEPEPRHFRLLPVTAQYHALINLDESAYDFQIKQEIGAKELDRFQIVLAFGRLAEPEFREGPWGYSLIFSPVMPGTESDKVRSASIKARLQLCYDYDRVLNPPPLAFDLYPIGYGYRARKVTGFKFEEKIALLTDEDVNVVESVAVLLARIGDSAALPGLERLNQTDLSYLRDYYSTQIYKKCPDPSYYDLPNPEERLQRFKRRLEDVIQYLKAENH
jgi:hypothetical protein